jgi:hypothetical protein
LPSFVDGINGDALQKSLLYVEIHRPIEILINLVYLTKHEPDNPAKVVEYMAMAETELTRLADIARELALDPETN